MSTPYISTTRKLLKPDEKIPSEIEKGLADLNKKTDLKFHQYKASIEEIFKLQKSNNFAITTNLKYYIGGFIEGEGSINVSMKKTPNSLFGHVVDPEFSITQQMDGVENLYWALCIFQTGKIHYKNSSRATLVFSITNNKSIAEKVIPFLEEYVLPFAGARMGFRAQKFIQLMTLINEKKHLEESSFINKVLPLWDELRVQVGQSNESFSSLQDAQKAIKDHIIKKKLSQ